MYIYCGCVLVKGCTFSEGSRGIEKGCCCCIERIFMRVVPEWKGGMILLTLISLWLFWIRRYEMIHFVSVIHPFSE